MADKTLVIKIGGSTLGQNDTTIEDLVSLQKIGYQLVVVHGGGRHINSWLDNLKIEPVFNNGLRVTDLKTLEVVSAVLCGLINKQIVSDIMHAGGHAIGISGVDGGIIQGKMNNAALGFTAEEITVNAVAIRVLLQNGYIPVISPVSLNISAEYNHMTRLVNVNGDTAAAAIASALQAGKLIFLTDVEGLYDQNKDIIGTITADAAEKLIDSNIISGGMAVKIKSCIRALAKVSLTRIVDGRVSHSLIREIDGNYGGTTIAAK
jgi:acetylglutamate kinase